MSSPSDLQRRTPLDPTSEVELAIDGMTCASCASRIERRLGRLDGVSASVNLATEKALVTFPLTVSPQDLVQAVQAAGYGATLPSTSPGHRTDDPGDGEPAPQQTDVALTRLEDLRLRVAVSAVLTVPVVALSMVPALQFSGWGWLALGLTLPVVCWAGSSFHRAAWSSLRHRAATMDTLVSMGTLAALLWSIYALVCSGATTSGAPDGAHVYFEAAAGVTTLVLLGRLLEGRAKRRAGEAVRALLELGAKEVDVLRQTPNGLVEQRISVTQLAVGDRFVVRPGQKIATDGVVEDGSAAVDAAMLTGEPLPVDVTPGDVVVGGSLDTDGRLVVRATRVGADTQLAQLAALVEQAQRGKAPVQALADRVSAIFVPVVLVLALLTLVGWLLVSGDADSAFTAAVAVLVIACPCALGLATPTALMVGTGRAAQLGIVIRGPQVLESTRRVDTIVLDKTGTVTTGRMSVTSVVPLGDTDRDELLGVAASLEAASEHPVAKAVVAASPHRRGRVEGFAAHGGLGVSGDVRDDDGSVRHVVVGRPVLVQERGAPMTHQAQLALDDARAQAGTAVVVAWDGVVRGVVVVADEVKATSPDAVRRLRGLGLTPVLLTGDQAVAALLVARQVGIDPERVVSDVLPRDKVEVVRRLQEQGRVVAMVGDGVNDAPALAQADLGLAMGSGTDAALEASDLTLVRDDLRAAVDAIRLSRQTLRIIKGNLFWAFAYNVAAIPLAMAGLLDPMVAAAAMAFSSVFVVANSLRLRRFSPIG